MNRREFEASVYLRNDHLTIKCILTVRKSLVSTTQFVNKIEAPPPSSSITEQLAKLLEAEENVDVTFSVGGDTIGAHKILLAVRSPVFRAELYGPMKESKVHHVTIEDMQPAIFRALLHFIYTDSLPDVDQKTGEYNSDLIWHLLVAADRYAVDRLKSLCETILCKNLDVETVATTLALAQQRNCDRLKDICLDFISSSTVMDAVMATDGYKDLKTTCPSTLIDMFEGTYNGQTTPSICIDRCPSSTAFARFPRRVDASSARRFMIPLPLSAGGRDPVRPSYPCVAARQHACACRPVPLSLRFVFYGWSKMNSRS
ncbi:BTB/POZ and MATH domain-containing protein 1-like [Panicum virgatum]|uniref:BTB/POZ and MATH domain-containing protein 1-like n=1 Tax=Panicum virgatum TaxID=38727 RepID=UPI0019D632D4|nr:BTB/POZ and MATH domain-containing protein 1-like [Panicum virgatum]